MSSELNQKLTVLKNKLSLLHEQRNVVSTKLDEIKKDVCKFDTLHDKSNKSSSLNNSKVNKEKNLLDLFKPQSKRANSNVCIKTKNVDDYDEENLNEYEMKRLRILNKIINKCQISNYTNKLIRKCKLRSIIKNIASSFDYEIEILNDDAIEDNEIIEMKRKENRCSIMIMIEEKEKEIKRMEKRIEEIESSNNKSNIIVRKYSDMRKKKKELTITQETKYKTIIMNTKKSNKKPFIPLNVIFNKVKEYNVNNYETMSVKQLIYCFEYPVISFYSDFVRKLVKKCNNIVLVRKDNQIMLKEKGKKEIIYAEKCEKKSPLYDRNTIKRFFKEDQMCDIDINQLRECLTYEKEIIYISNVNNNIEFEINTL